MTSSSSYRIITILTQQMHILKCIEIKKLLYSSKKQYSFKQNILAVTRLPERMKKDGYGHIRLSF